MRGRVRRGRLGDAEYEGTGRRGRLEAGQTRHVRFTTGCRAAHPALKLQVYVVGMDPAREADLLVDSTCIGVIPDGLADDFSEGKMDFRAANRLLRVGRHNEAATVSDLLFGPNRSEGGRVGKGGVGTGSIRW